MDTDVLNYQKFLDGDLEGFENLVIKYKNNLIFFIMKYIKDIDLSEDLAQDAFVEVYVHKERYNFKTSFKTYLFTIGRNKAVDYIRKYGRELPSGDFAFMEAEQQMGELQKELLSKAEKLLPDEVSLLNENIEMVHKALYQLKKEYASVIHLIDLEGLSYSETAKVMNKTVAQIKIMIYRARKSLKKVLQEEGFIYEDR